MHSCQLFPLFVTCDDISVHNTRNIQVGVKLKTNLRILQIHNYILIIQEVRNIAYLRRSYVHINRRRELTDNPADFHIANQHSSLDKIIRLTLGLHKCQPVEDSFCGQISFHSDTVFCNVDKLLLVGNFHAMIHINQFDNLS